ncbi:S8 family serine peptidase [Streptomyces sp. NPDC055210]
MAPTTAAHATETALPTQSAGAGRTTDVAMTEAATTDSAVTDGGRLTEGSRLTDDGRLADVVAGSGASVPVTLITGDKLDVGLDAVGKPVVQDIEPAPRSDGSTVVFHTIAHGGAVHVVPNDALALVGDDVLDWSLFDVVELAKLGTAGRTGEVPVIATYDDEDAVARTPKVAGATRGRALPSVDGRALTLSDDGTWWKGVRGKSGSASAARAAGSLAGVQKVWLNGLAEVTLDVSVPQIGADVAWSRGYRGAGVDVAVLDTGIDATHPDLAGRIVEQVDFTGNAQGAKDGHGHGTHVASTVLGDGAASGGRYKGVAPQARLRVGKVCTDAGSCPDDAVIAGMEWAARSGAKVVNMSLGGSATDGTDPLSASLDRLSRETGTLFVVAAGNEGPGARTVGAPGAADEALTVAAVDKKDKMASFSSRGPRVGDYAPKPDLAAPGVGIVAARAAGTAMGTVVDARYTAANGTSMATPHVTGAAAVVAQQHPDLTGGQIKALLMSSAKDLGHAASAQGVGRVDLAAATLPQVIATRSTAFGRAAYPHSAVTREITYTNLTDEATTLDLTASLSSGGAVAPAGMVSLGADRVPLPAGGSASVSVTIDGRVLGADGTFGRWDGLLTARDTSGAVRATSLLHTFLEAEQVPLTLKIVPPAGAVGVRYGSAVVMPVDDKVLLHDGPLTRSGSQTITVPVSRRGTYTAAVPVTWRDADGEPQSAAPVLPEVTVDEATTVTLDLRELTPVEVRVPESTEAYATRSSTERTSATGEWRMTTELAVAYGAQDPHWWALPTGKPRTGTLTHSLYSVRTTPVVTLRAVGGGKPFTLPARYQTPDASLLGAQIWMDGPGIGLHDIAIPVPRLRTQGRVPVVYAGTGSATELADADVRGKLVLLTPTDICDSTCNFPRLRDERVAAAAESGAVGVLVTTANLTSLGTDDVLWECSGGQETCPPVEPYAALPVVSVGHAQAQRLIERIKAGGPGVELVLGGSATPKVYAARFTTDGRVPSDLRHRLDAGDLNRVVHSFHDDRPGVLTQLTWQQQTPSAPTGTTARMPLVATQQRLTVFVARQDDAIDRFSAFWGDHADGLALERSRGETHDTVLRRTDDIDWNAGPAVPGAVPQVRTASGFTLATGPCSACRQGDTFYPTFYLTGSGGGRQALVGILNDDLLSESLFGITSCGPAAPPGLPTIDSHCDFTLSDGSGHEIERRTQHLNAADLGGQ